MIDPVVELSKVRTLSLTHTNVSNKEIARLAHLQHLDSLDLHMSKMHEGPVPDLERLRLKTLLLNRTRVDDESIQALRLMDKLEYIDLTRTKVTDAGLKHLESLPKLNRVILRRSLVTRDGFEAFKKSHQLATVSWEPLDR